jgi:hypothetical protein
MSDVTIPQELWDHELTSQTPAPVDWLWDGFVAGGQLTLLTSLWKAGKTTLLALLLGRRKAGGTLAGLAVRPGKSVVVSEEPPELWAERARRHDFGGQVCFLCQPFRGVTRPEQWQALLGRLLELRRQQTVDLAVIDPLAPYLGAENQARSMLQTMLPLAELTAAGMAVLLLHHPPKGHPPLGQAARGSGALLGHVDIAVEMRHPGGDPLTRRRFIALSRHAATPRHLLLELNAEGTDYLPVATAAPDDETLWEPLRLVLEDAPQKLTRQDILDEWPPDFERPERTTLWRWLDRGGREPDDPARRIRPQGRPVPLLAGVQRSPLAGAFPVRGHRGADPAAQPPLRVARGEETPQGPERRHRGMRRRNWKSGGFGGGNSCWGGEEAETWCGTPLQPSELR